MRALIIALALLSLTAVAWAGRSRVVSLSHARRVNEHDTVSLLIAVKQNNLQQLEATCTSVSDPNSEKYGQYLSLDEVAELVGNPQGVRAVATWAKKNKALSVKILPTNDFVRVRLPAQVAEKELKIQLHLFKHPAKKTLVMRANAKYTLPAALRGLVDRIAGVEKVDMEKPTTIVPISPRAHGHGLTHKPKPTRKAPLAGDSEIYIDEVDFANGTQAIFYIEQICYNGDEADEEDWPCSSTSDPIASYKVVVGELKAGTKTTITITKANAKTYQFQTGGYGYTFVLPGMVQFGHYQFNITSTGANGDTSPVAAYPGDAYDTGSDAFTVNYVSGVPSLFHTLYNIPAAATTATNNSVAMAAFMGETYSPEDLDQYLKEYKISGTSSKNVHVIGYNEDEGGDETMLDVEMEANVAPNVPLYYIYTGDDASSMDFLLEWGASISTLANAPLVHSISYGLPESMYEEYFSIPIDEYASRTNVELQKICTRGITVLVASGDGGSTDIGHGGDDCTLAPMYPASSPWVTTVGATAVDTWAGTKSTGAPGEVVVAITNGQFWTTGGGFSQVASQATPSYQKAAVAAYFKAAPYLPAGFNQSARGFPDIAALGDNIMVVVEGEDEDSGGTSASSPMTAAMIAHINAARLAAGKAAVGFFNPLLYQIFAEHPEVFFDVTIGDIACGDEECCPKDIGYPATKGWDAASGVGSIDDLQALVKVALTY